jgi:hypothetical protein
MSEGRHLLRFGLEGNGKDAGGSTRTANLLATPISEVMLDISGRLIKDEGADRRMLKTRR